MSAAFGNLALGLNAAGQSGPVVNLLWPQSTVALQVEISGTPVACQILLKGQIMGGTFDTLAILDVAEGYVSGQVQPIAFPIPVRNFFAQLGALSGGGNLSVNVYYAGNRLDES